MQVLSDDDLRSAFKQVQGEVPGSPVFAMKLAPPSRHLEVQLICDEYGGVASIYSRDCSVQRRHQKIVEEGPVSKVTPCWHQKDLLCPSAQLPVAKQSLPVACLDPGKSACYFLFMPERCPRMPSGGTPFMSHAPAEGYLCFFSVHIKD